MSNHKLKLFTGNANRQLGEEIAEYLGISLGQAKVKRFADGETAIEINESVRGADVFLIQPTCSPVNDNLMELLIMMDACRRASAQRITAVIPYYGYARQERKSKARDPISAKLVANLITEAGADRVIAMDLHANAIQGVFDIPVDHRPAVPMLAEYSQSMDTKDLVVVSPDVGGMVRARNMAKRLGVDLAIVDKRREEANKAEILSVVPVPDASIVPPKRQNGTSEPTLRVVRVVKNGSMTCCTCSSVIPQPLSEMLMVKSLPCRSPLR